MPEISRFFGIVVRMFHDDHGVPHFHVYAGGEDAVIEIERLSLLEGALQPRRLGLVIEWAAQHRAELMANWELARQGAALKRIPPLT
jgi:hypothetical protein